MKQNEIALEKITDLVNQLEPYFQWPWSSEGDTKIEVVKLPYWRIAIWTELTFKEETDFLRKIQLTDAYKIGIVTSEKPFKRLIDYLFEGEIKIYRRQKKGSSTVYLYLLRNFGWWNVGIKVKFIET